MIVISLPGMIALLLPVIGIETLFVMKRTSLLEEYSRPRPRRMFHPRCWECLFAWTAFFVCEMVVGLGLDGISQVVPKLYDANVWNSPAAYAVGSILFAAWIGGEANLDGPARCTHLANPIFFHISVDRTNDNEAEVAGHDGGTLPR